MTQTQADAGVSLDLGDHVKALVKATFSLEGAASDLRESFGERAAYAKRVKLNEVIIPIPHLSQGQITAASANNSSTGIELRGPRTGWWWEVRRITCSDFTGGTVQCYLSHAEDDAQILAPFSVAGTYLLGGGQLLLPAGERLLFASSSAFTGTARIGIGVIQVRADYIAEYLL